MIIIHNRNDSGFTLVEILVVISIIAIITVAVSSYVRIGGGIWETENKHTEVFQNALIGLDKISRELKQAKEITSVSDPDDPNGYIIFTDVNGNIGSSFQYKSNGSISDYLEYGSSGEKMAGPITSLKFQCSQVDGVIPTTDPDKIRLIKIDMVAKDSNTAITVPVSSEVSLGNEERYVIDLLDYYIYAGTDFSLKNDTRIKSPTQMNPPVNLGANNIGTIYQGSNIYGNIITKQGLMIENNARVWGNVYCASDVTVSNGGTVDGTVYYFGNLTVGNTATIGGSQKGGITDFFFYNPLPDPASINASNDPGRDVKDSMAVGGIITLSPGQYRDVTAGNKTLKLPVNSINYRYDFKSIKSNKDVHLDIIGISASVGIQIFVEGDLDVKNLNITLDGVSPNPTNPTDKAKLANIYLESHGNIKAGGSWLGTFYASGNGNIAFDNGSVTGNLYCQNQVLLLQPSTVMIFIRPNPSILPPQWSE